MKRMIDIHDIIQSFEVAQKDALKGVQTVSSEKMRSHYNGVHEGLLQAKMIFLHKVFHDEVLED